MTDRVTLAWLWGALFVALGLPVLLVVGFFVFRVQIIDAVVAWIPVEREQQVADEIWKAQRSQFTFIEDTQANRFVDDVGTRLVATQASPYRYHFHVVDDNAVNAFAMPGGYVVVNRGLIEKAANADEVAGVLAHEIEHVEQRHTLRGMVQSIGLVALWTVISGDVLGGTTGEMLRNLAGLQFSREQEMAADRGGFMRLVAAGIDPHGMASFFETLAATQGTLPGALSMLSTHPASEERAAELRKLLVTAPALPSLAGDWSAVQQSLPR